MPLHFQAELNEDIIEGTKPQIMEFIDDNTKELLADPNHLFNLTLTTYPKQQRVYLGKLHL